MTEKRIDQTPEDTVSDSDDFGLIAPGPQGGQGGNEDTVCMSLSAVMATAAPETTATLQVITGHSATRTFTLTAPETVLGRDESCGIPFTDSDISRRHASIQIQPKGGALLTDLKSRNGCWFQEKRVGQVLLQNGDKFRLGNSVVIKFQLQDRLEQECMQQLYENATRDPLTGAFNKKHVTERVQEEFAYCSRHGLPLAVMMMDIDHFKQVNDTYGHTPAGDSVLNRLAALLSSTIRTEDVLGRFGGEEFVLVCRGIDRPEAARLAERLRRTVEHATFPAKALDGGRVKIPVRVSVGVAVSHEGNYEAPQELLSSADRALYQAKRTGRNRVVCDAPPQRPTAPMISAPSRPKVGGILVRMGRLTKEQLKLALLQQKSGPAGRTLGTILLELGFCTQTDIAAALAAQYGVETGRGGGGGAKADAGED